MTTSEPSCIACSAHDRLRRLSVRRPLIRRVNAVIDGVADEVEQGVRQLMQDTAVQLGVFTAHFPANVLAQAPRCVAHRSLQRVGDRGNRNHARPHRSFLQADQQSRQFRELGDVGGLDADALGEHTPDAQVRGSGLADHAHEFVEALDRHHDGARALATARGCSFRRRRRGDRRTGWKRCLSWCGSRCRNGCRSLNGGGHIACDGQVDDRHR